METSKSEVEPRHCDDYIRDKSQPKCLRKFLLYHRIPAYWQIKRWRWGVPELYADYNGSECYEKGQRVRVVMVSSFGDVGITSDLSRDHGYDWRVSLEDLTNFSEES